MFYLCELWRVHRLRVALVLFATATTIITRTSQTPMTTENSVEICSNCRRPINKHRPWCATYKLESEVLKLGDVMDHPVFGPTELISVYTRQEAITDGVLVDCTDDFFDDLNRNAGVIFDVAMTRAVFERYVEVPEWVAGSQDMKGRYWDLLTMFKLASKRNPDGHELHFEFLSTPNGSDSWGNEGAGSSPERRLVQLKAVSGPGDRGEPCLTFMLPWED
jgi:hypothetical protein